MLGLIQLPLGIHCKERLPGGTEVDTGSKIGPGAQAGYKTDKVRCIEDEGDDSTCEWHTVENCVLECVQRKFEN